MGEKDRVRLGFFYAESEGVKTMDLNEQELLTQQEVADYFSVVSSTIKNWRDRGLFSYFQAPGSKRVLYFADEIKDFRDKNTFNGKGGIQSKKKAIKRVKPVVSINPEKEWRI